MTEIDEKLHCPFCYGKIRYKKRSYNCSNCGKIFKDYKGIIDFRVFSPPYVSIEKEKRHVEELIQNYDRCTYEELVRFYFENLGRTIPEGLRTKFIEYRLSYGNRGQKTLDEINDIIHRLGHSINFGCVLDLGCGSGGSLLTLSNMFEYTIGIDISLTELILAKKLLDEKSIRNVILVCGCAESLPFKNEIFDLTVGLDVIEHVKDQKKVIKETARTLKKPGHLFFTSPNRYSIFPEPHVNLIGIGFLPRKLTTYYVQLRKGVPYTGKRLLSYGELSHLMEKNWGEDYTISIYKGDKLKGIKFMEYIFKLPIISQLIYFFYPVHIVIAYTK